MFEIDETNDSLSINDVIIQLTTTGQLNNQKDIRRCGYHFVSETVKNLRYTVRKVQYFYDSQFTKLCIFTIYSLQRGRRKLEVVL